MEELNPGLGAGLTMGEKEAPTMGKKGQISNAGLARAHAPTASCAPPRTS